MKAQLLSVSTHEFNSKGDLLMQIDLRIEINLQAMTRQEKRLLAAVEAYMQRPELDLDIGHLEIE